jgi:hypothetical protein
VHGVPGRRADGRALINVGSRRHVLSRTDSPLHPPTLRQRGLERPLDSQGPAASLTRCVWLAFRAETSDLYFQNKKCRSKDLSRATPSAERGNESAHGPVAMTSATIARPHDVRHSCTRLVARTRGSGGWFARRPVGVHPLSEEMGPPRNPVRFSPTGRGGWHITEAGAKGLASVCFPP